MPRPYRCGAPLREAGEAVVGEDAGLFGGVLLGDGGGGVAGEERADRG